MKAAKIARKRTQMKIIRVTSDKKFGGERNSS